MKKHAILLSDTNVLSDLLKPNKLGKLALLKLATRFQLVIPEEVKVELLREWPRFKESRYGIIVHKTTKEELIAAACRLPGNNSMADKVCLELFFRNAIEKKNENYQIASSDTAVYDEARRMAHASLPGRIMVHRTFGLLRVLIDEGELTKRQAAVIGKAIAAEDPRYLMVPFDSFVSGLFSKSEPAPDLDDVTAVESISKSITSKYNCSNGDKCKHPTQPPTKLKKRESICYHCKKSGE